MFSFFLRDFCILSLVMLIFYLCVQTNWLSQPLWTTMFHIRFCSNCFVWKINYSIYFVKHYREFTNASCNLFSRNWNIIQSTVNEMIILLLNHKQASTNTLPTDLKAHLRSKNNWIRWKERKCNYLYFNQSIPIRIMSFTR